MSVSDLPPAPGGRIVEVKERIDGTVLRYGMECWLWTPDLVVGRWVVEPGSSDRVPDGYFSWGVWWRTRAYGAYRTHWPDGTLRRYRLDALDRVRFVDGEVHYRDLLLDAWIDPVAGPELEDEDEVAEAVASGALTAHEHRRVLWTRELMLRRWEVIMRRVDAAVERAIEGARS